MVQKEVDAIIKSLLLDQTREVKKHSHLIDELGFDSVHIMELITELETHFKIIFEDEHLELDFFQTPQKIYDLLKRYTPNEQSE